jgi:BRCT domain type II-containing protein
MSSEGSTLRFSSTAVEAAEANKANIEGKVFVITGAYSGIGLEAAKVLLKAGGKVVIGGGQGDSGYSRISQEGWL